jgi:hypothetical protein
VRSSNVIVALSCVIIGLSAVAAASGVLWSGERGPVVATTLRGQTTEIFGAGLYRYDTLFFGAGNRGTDAIVLLFDIPLLTISTWRYRRGSVRAAILLLGTLGFFLYVYATYALGVALNEMFLLYFALFSASLFASGLVTLAVWLVPVLVAQLEDRAPERLDHNTTLVTYALDLAIITPATFIAGAFILHGAPIGYLVAFSLLVFETMLAPLIAAQTVSQVAAGVSFPPGQMVGPIAGFAVLALAALWVYVSLLRNIPDSTRAEEAPRAL